MHPKTVEMYKYEEYVRITEAARANVNRCKSSACAHAVTCGAVQARDLLPTPAR